MAMTCYCLFIVWRSTGKMGSVARLYLATAQGRLQCNDDWVCQAEFSIRIVGAETAMLNSNLVFTD